MAHIADPDVVIGLPDPERSPEFYESVPLKRFLAWCIDSVFIFSIALMLSIATLGLGFFIFAAMAFLISLTYRWMMLATSASTWGMRIMAIQLRDRQGHKVSNLTALLHTLAYQLSISSGIIQLISVVMMLASDRKQGLPDFLLGTAMINNPREG